MHFVRFTDFSRLYFPSMISKHHCPPVEHGKGCVQGFSFACSNKCDISVEVPAMMEILWHTTIVTMYTYTYMPSIPLQWPCQSHKGRSVPREVCGHSTLLWTSGVHTNIRPPDYIVHMYREEINGQRTMSISIGRNFMLRCVCVPFHCRWCRRKEPWEAQEPCSLWCRWVEWVHSLLQCRLYRSRRALHSPGGEEEEEREGGGGQVGGEREQDGWLSAMYNFGGNH